MFEGLTSREVSELQWGVALTDRVLEARTEGRPWDAISADVGLSEQTLRRWLKRRERFDAGERRALLRGRSTGRRPSVDLTPDEVKALQEKYLRTNRNRKDGSKTMAARLLARDPQSALSDETREAILKRRASKHSLPKPIMDAMSVAPSLMRHHRSPKDGRLSGMYCPGTMRTAGGAGSVEGAMRRLRAGERQSWDDGSINFCVCVPWPWGGDRCADRFGVKVGRFQLLAGIDDAWDFCPGFSFVMRPLQSYRKEDAAGAQFRVWRDTYVPDRVVLEGGSWQSGMVMRFYETIGMAWDDAKGRPHQKLVENYWNRLWSVLSVEDGQIGRYRGEMERENDLLIRCQKGRLDPREVFPDLGRGLAAIRKGIEFLNSEPVESDLYGSWVPEEMHAEQLRAFPRRALDPALGWMIAPEQHERTVRRQGMVKVRARTPFGESFPYFFCAEELMDFEGRRVRVHFDPWDEPLRATVVLLEPWMGRRRGEVLTHRAECINSVPQIMDSGLDLGGADLAGWDESGLSRALRIRKELSRVLRTEYRALVGPGGVSAGEKSVTEIRGADGSRLNVESGTGVDDGVRVGAPGQGLEEKRAKPGKGARRKIRSRFELATKGEG